MSSHLDAKTIVALVPHNPSYKHKKNRERGKNRGQSKRPPGASLQQWHCYAPPPGSKTGQNGDRQAVHNRAAMECSE